MKDDEWLPPPFGTKPFPKPRYGKYIVLAGLSILLGVGIWALANAATREDASAKAAIVAHYRACETLGPTQRQSCIEGVPRVVVITRNYQYGTYDYALKQCVTQANKDYNSTTKAADYGNCVKDVLSTSIDRETLRGSP